MLHNRKCSKLWFETWINHNENLRKNFIYTFNIKSNMSTVIKTHKNITWKCLRSKSSTFYMNKQEQVNENG